MAAESREKKRCGAPFDSDSRVEFELAGAKMKFRGDSGQTYLAANAGKGRTAVGHQTSGRRICGKGLTHGTSPNLGGDSKWACAGLG